MGNFLISLLGKLTKVDIEHLQSENSHLQGENVKLSTLLRESNQQLYSAERKVEQLQNRCDQFDPSEQEKIIQQLKENVFAEKENELNALSQMLDEKENLLKAKEEELKQNFEEQQKALQKAEQRLQELQQQLYALQQDKESSIEPSVVEFQDRTEGMTSEDNSQTYDNGPSLSLSEDEGQYVSDEGTANTPTAEPISESETDEMVTDTGEETTEEIAEDTDKEITGSTSPALDSPESGDPQEKEPENEEDIYTNISFNSETDDETDNDIRPSITGQEEIISETENIVEPEPATETTAETEESPIQETVNRPEDEEDSNFITIEEKEKSASDPLDTDIKEQTETTESASEPIEMNIIAEDEDYADTPTEPADNDTPTIENESAIETDNLNPSEQNTDDYDSDDFIVQFDAMEDNPVAEETAPEPETPSIPHTMDEDSTTLVVPDNGHAEKTTADEEKDFETTPILPAENSLDTDISSSGETMEDSGDTSANEQQDEASGETVSNDTDKTEPAPVTVAETQADKDIIERNTGQSQPQDTPSTLKHMTAESMNNLRSQFPYIRITLRTYSQYIYDSNEINVIVGLFETGIEGKELITDHNIYVEENEILSIEGMDSPFTSEEIQCDFSNEDTSEEAAQILLTAICTGQPLFATYNDKNGHITERNMYHICFKPHEKRFTLPYKNLFSDLFNEEQELDTENIAAMTQRQDEPKIFIVSQILSIRPYNAFVSTTQGLKFIKEGIKIAKKNEQTEFAKLIKSEIHKRIPSMPTKVLGR